jgi:hypothetical protein
LKGVRENDGKKYFKKLGQSSSIACDYFDKIVIHGGIRIITIASLASQESGEDFRRLP